MAKIDNLTDFLTDLADGIREIEGTQEDINPQDFRSRIESFIKETPSITVNTWPVSIENNSNYIDTFTIYYINGNSQNATATCARGTTVSINVAVNTYLKVVNSTYRVIYSVYAPTVAACYPVLMYSSECVYWFGDASNRPTQSLTLSSYHYTCNITIDTTDGYGSIGFSYVNSSGTRTDVTVANNTTKTYTVSCGSEIRISDISGNGTYIYESGYYMKRATDGTYDAYIAPNIPYATFKMTLSRD